MTWQDVDRRYAEWEQTEEGQRFAEQQAEAARQAREQKDNKDLSSRQEGDDAAGA